MHAAAPLEPLSELAEELREERPGATPRLSLEMADRTLIARNSLELLQHPHENETSFDYLVKAWVRCWHAQQRVRTQLPPHLVQLGTSALENTRGLITSYIGLVMQMPDMFPRDSKRGMTVSPKSLVPTLLNIGATDTLAYDGDAEVVGEWSKIPSVDASQFLVDIVARFGPEGTLDDTVGAALYAMTQRVRSGVSNDTEQEDRAQRSEPTGDVQQVLAQLLGMPDPRMVSGSESHAEPHGMAITDLNWRPIQLAVVAMMEYKPLASAVASFQVFCPQTSAAMMERESLFGPLLRLSCFADAYPDIAKTYFTEAKTRSPYELENSMSSLRMSLNVVQSNNFHIFNALVRAGAAPRERVLQYFGTVCALNAKRGAMQVRSKEVASDAFMVNVYDIVLRFAAPFAEPTCAKIDRVDPEYMLRQARWDTKTLTRIHASETQGAEWVESGARYDTPPNFITEIFFIGVRLSNLALGKAMRRVDEREKEMDHLQKRIKEFEDSRVRWEAMAHAGNVENLLKRLAAQRDKLHSEVIAAQTQLLEPGFVQGVIGFVGFTMTWLVRLADPDSAHPATQITLPLPRELPELFRMLPEHIFEDVCDIILFYSRRKPDVLDVHAQNTIVVFSTTFLSSGWFIRNPFLKAKLAEMLSYNVMPYDAHPAGVMGDVVNSHPVALKHLVPSLMAFWIDAESTGSASQFYDKFNFRYHLTQIFKAIWDNPDHKKQLYREAEEHQTEFVVFINRLMNDVTYLLDDALDKLAELHTKQLEMDDADNWAALSPQEREEIESATRSIESQIRSDLSLGHEFLRLLIRFTSETSKAFMTPEVVDRLAAMLDYNLDVLVGPRCQELKVKDPKRIGFDPRNMLREILAVFLNLAPHDEFAAAMARDGRSYRRETFSKAATIAQRHMLLSPPEIDVLATLVDRVERIKQTEAEKEQDLGDIPDEYLDPLLATIMRDPVRLPASRMVIDRSTIKAHLLSDGTDPFNRMPLKLDDVLPADDVRQEIQAWLQERQAAARK
ncbi:RING-type E3 ubiquitin transferase [Malassezia vespertilionis]|uniref:RING-type E3 ubiquitin transferase n=1 Tax=Malassezia vespertilionis TaxID=2020962 RepID=UPI0024B0BF2F|nr:RING-type E3 ubiquitin transferase [Malassezia vespertilionis]WFD06541.1 RING-type E3 ubiquitin transferase [Malassezia vespertilionis]